MQYEQRKCLLKKPSKPGSSESAAPPPAREHPVHPNQPVHHQPLQTFCWRCKGNHTPTSFPQWNSKLVNRASSPRLPQPPANRLSHGQGGRATLGFHTHSGYPEASTCFGPSTHPPESPLPCQLLVPLNVCTWKKKTPSWTLDLRIPLSMKMCGQE